MHKMYQEQRKCNVKTHIFQKKMALLLLLCMMVSLFVPFVSVQAEDFAYTNPSTEYQAMIYDEAGLFEGEEDMVGQIQEVLQQMTQWGDIAVITLSQNDNTTRYYAEKTCEQLFGKESSSVFIIDMDNREIYIYSFGRNKRYIRPSKANTITDNTYQYATRGEYATCALKSLEQMLIVLKGGRINQRMKYVSNALLALLFACVITFYMAKSNSVSNMAEVDELLASTDHITCIDGFSKNLLKRRKSRHSDDSSSGGGSSGGGGGGGGGGGHSF